ncbi:MAG: hypothetical protein OXG35_07640 [Acidobacteria bacterium]|nr:hypothetical protein [Acidobacteriota bacterium]
MGYPAKDGLGSTPITRSKAREIVESARRSSGLVFLTGRCEGPDLMLWTVEVLVKPGRPRIR